jgi:hypothetical protein
MSESALQAREDERRQSGHGTLAAGTPQQRASFVRCSSQTPHVASPQSRHLPSRGLRASQHRRNTTGLRENFDPRARWRNAVSAARVLSRFGNHNGANKHKDKPVVSSDNEDDDGGGGSTSRRATPKTDDNSYRRRHRTIAYRGAGWQDSWRQG